MTSYTVTLKNEEDFQILKKLLKAFDGASITPAKSKKSHLDIALKEVSEGKISGPYKTVDSLMNDLLN